MPTLSLSRDNNSYLPGLLSKLVRLYAQYLDQCTVNSSDKIVTIHFNKPHLIGVVKIKETAIVSVNFKGKPHECSTFD